MLSAKGYREEEVASHLGAVKEGNSGIVAAGCAAEAVVKDPFLTVLELDPRIMKPARDLGGPGFNHNPHAPGLELPVKNSIPDLKIDVSGNPGRTAGDRFRSFLRQSTQGISSFPSSFVPIADAPRTIDPDTAGSSLRGSDSPAGYWFPHPSSHHLSPQDGGDV